MKIDIKTLFKANNKRKKSFCGQFLCILGLSVILIIVLFVSVWAYVRFFDKNSSCGVSLNQINKNNSYYNNSDFYKNNNYIEVDFLTGEQKIVSINNPVIISGMANVYEATIYIRIVDRNNKILLDSFVSADGWMDQKYHFSTEVSYEKPSTEGGYIELFEKNPKDGSESNRVIVPVVFEN